jgi:dihydrofolate reductase
MRKVTAFNFITLNGFYKGMDEDISWHRHGSQEAKFSEQSLERDNILLFGRKTYETMVAFWPTPMAKELFPKVAEGMNKAEKIVFSRTMNKADWNNTRVVSGNIVDEIKVLKRTARKDMTILGSGSIIVQLAEEGLIDDYEILVDPVAIGVGTPIFEGITRKLDLKLMKTRVFKSGTVLLCFRPIRRRADNVRHKT